MKNPFIYCLYIHINKINGKVYIGISSCNNINHRWQHGFGYRTNKHFFAAIQKYGWDGFYHIILRTGLSHDEANSQEIRWIYLFRADEPQYGYNVSKGGDGYNKGKKCCDPDYMKKYFREWRVKNKERNAEVQRKYKEKFKEEHGISPEGMRRRQLKNKYRR